MAHDATNIHQSDYPASWPSGSFPSDSLLFANPTYSDVAVPSPSPSLATLHDSYYPQNPGPMYNAPGVPTRIVPRIHVETEMPRFSSSNFPYDHHSPYNHSPQGLSPSTVVPTSYPHSSPSSIGSAPPVTPETPYTSVSPHTPYINHSPASPISPSYVASQPPTFDPKVKLSVFPCCACTHAVVYRSLFSTSPTRLAMSWTSPVQLDIRMVDCSSPRRRTDHTRSAIAAVMWMRLNSRHRFCFSRINRSGAVSSSGTPSPAGSAPWRDATTRCFKAGGHQCPSG